MCKFNERHGDLDLIFSSCYSVFVNGRERSTILKDMQARIDRGVFALERIDAIRVGTYLIATINSY